MEVIVTNITSSVEIEAGYDLYEIVVFEGSEENARQYAIEAALSAGDALEYSQQAEADKVQTGLDRIATGADRVQTGLDVITTTEQATIATEAVQNIPLQITPITLLTSGWALIGDIYEYVYSNENIKIISIVDVIPSNSTIAIVQEASILPETQSSLGSVKIYSVNLPTADILVTINIFK